MLFQSDAGPEHLGPPPCMDVSRENAFRRIRRILKQCGMTCMQSFDPRAFIENQIKEIDRLIGGERALIAISGGVDSPRVPVLV